MVSSPCCNLFNSNSKACGLNSLTTTGFFTMCRHHALAQKGETALASATTPSKSRLHWNVGLICSICQSGPPS